MATFRGETIGGDMKAILLASMVALTSAACATAQPSIAPSAQRGDTLALRRTLDSIADSHRGVLGYVVHNLDTGERLTRRADETFPTASLIKVPILVALFDLVEKGQISLSDPLTILSIDQVGGSGVLQRLHNGAVITVGDAAWMMTIISDNTATNLLLDKVAIRRVWQKMESLGLPHTRIHSKTFQRFTSVAMDSSVKYGLGVTTPAEMARLYELLARGEAVSPRADSMMLAILEQNEDEQMMQRFTYGVRAATKTGAVDAARNECSLFYLRSRVVVCAMTRENLDQRYAVDTEAHVSLARIGEAVMRTWPPARSSQ
jgi:beta-lactamase class A